jgi:hypothetical protein
MHDSAALAISHDMERVGRERRHFSCRVTRRESAADNANVKFWNCGGKGSGIVSRAFVNAAAAGRVHCVFLGSKDTLFTVASNRACAPKGPSDEEQI